MAKVIEKLIQNWQEYYTGKVYIITEDMVTVTTDATKGVAPYNTSYGYTNITIDANAGIIWEVGAAYIFVINTEMVVASAYRNVRVRIGTGAYIPIKNRANTILAGNSYMVKGRSDFYIYKKTYETNGALHLSAGSDTTYSTMSVAEWKTGTATSSRVVRADYLKQIIEYYIEQNAPTIWDATITLEDQNGNEIGNFTTNATADQTITINTGGGGGGGDLDVAAANALIDVKLGNYDTLFSLNTGLYKILNWLSDEDELGLTEWEDRDEITDNNASMSLISHSYTVMVCVANSSDAMAMVCSKDGATKEVSECWNSIYIIANNEKARGIYLNSEYGNYYLSNYPVVQDAFGGVLNTLRGKQLLPFLTIDIYYSQIMSTPELKDSLSVCTLDDLTPAVCYYAELTGYDTWDDITSDSTALNTVLNNSTCMEILNCSSEFIWWVIQNIPLFVNNQAIMEMVANNAELMNLCVNDSTTMAAIAGSSIAMWEMVKSSIAMWAIAGSSIAMSNIIKSSTAITEITKSDNNSVLQAQKTTMYNTVVWDSTNFTQITRTYADYVPSLNGSTGTANCIVFFAGGYYSSSSHYSIMFHPNGVQAVSANQYYRPTSVSDTQLSWISFTNCTFNESGDWRAAIAVYQAN